MSDIHAISILGVPVHAVSMESAITHAGALLHDGKQHLITTPNPEMIVAASRNPRFAHALSRADLAIPDGAGLLWAAQYLRTPFPFPRLHALVSLIGFAVAPSKRGPLPARVSGVDFVCALAQRFRTERWFLLGGATGIADRAAIELKRRYPGLTVVGTHVGSPADPIAIARINETKPTVLLVAFGHEKQELWITEHLSQLPSVKLAMGVGGTFDFLAGDVHRAPDWIRRMKLEWLWRLVLQPWRWKRIWTAVVTFSALVVRKKLRSIS